MKTVILVPRREGVAERDRLWEFVREWWANDHPDWPIIEGHHNEGPFNRAAAINTAARRAGDWDVAVIIDADVLTNPDRVRSAADIAASTGAMVLSHHERVMLSRQGTERILGGFRGNWREPGMVDRSWFDGCSCCVAVSRPLWDLVGGFDEHFVGWGYEDVAFRIACEELSGKPLVGLASELWHLWHTTSHENNPREATYQANVARGEAYRSARGNPAAIRELVDEPLAQPAAATLDAAVIPRIMHRTIPAVVTEVVEHYWTHLQQLHPGWEFRTYREPLDPADWPLTGDLWDRCANGAQKAGLIRLEALVTHGGVYVDSDCEPVRSLEPLLAVEAFAGWEDETTVPDAVLGARPQHPAMIEALAQASAAVEAGGDAWASGPGVTTAVLPGRVDVLLLPPGAFYPHHYLQKNLAHSSPGPWVFLRHQWAGSWLTDAQRQSIVSRQR